MKAGTTRTATDRSQKPHKGACAGAAILVKCRSHSSSADAKATPRGVLAERRDVGNTAAKTRTDVRSPHKKPLLAQAWVRFDGKLRPPAAED